MYDIDKTSRAEIAKTALGEVGVLEVGGNNRGPRVNEYQSATWLKPAPWPWCAAFVCWVIREWAPRRISFRSQAAFEQWRPRTAGAIDFEVWAAHRGALVLDAHQPTEAGDIVTFKFGHIGIVAADAPASEYLIKTVEGNTGPMGLRDSDSGDGVFAKERTRDVIRKFIRMVPATADRNSPAA